VALMRAERRRRARAAARGRRWAGPARRASVRTGGGAVSAVDAGVLVVRSQRALRGMEADLRSGERSEPVVGLSCLEEINEPVLAPRRVRAIVGAGPRIYYVPGQDLLRRLQGWLGQRIALTVGGVRVWWPGLLAGRSDPGEHPLVLALDSESQAEMPAEFDRQFNLSPPLRGEIRLIKDARRLAEYEFSQARDESRAIEGERDRVLAHAWEAERALEAARSRVSGRRERA
jgi:hypothetical protein